MKVGWLMNILELFKNKDKDLERKDAIARLLQVSPEMLKEFEESYRKSAIEADESSENLFDKSIEQVRKDKNPVEWDNAQLLDNIVDRIVDELLVQTDRYVFDGSAVKIERCSDKDISNPVTIKELNGLNVSERPQLTGSLMKIDIDTPSYVELLQNYVAYLENPESEKGRLNYCLFRQGLDILDLDSVVYKILGMNKNSIGYWFPELVKGVRESGDEFFRIPKTTIIKVPMTLLQLTRCNYMELTSTTLKIVDSFCKKAFNLDTSKEYFIKTGTYSSKFDFRNAYVHGEKEVNELGEYLLYIHFLALQMASPLSSRQMYGVSTTNEWAVREFIQDKENNPKIYKGMPLHTEYRIFVDFESGKIIGKTPYWEPETMKRRFAHSADSDSPHQIHDYIIFKAYENILEYRYNDNIEKVCSHIERIIPNINLQGQWAIDIMQNGDEFWVIDMSLAQNSALVDRVPKELLRLTKEDWIPKLVEHGQNDAKTV